MKKTKAQKQKSEEAARKHAVAEQLRRKRINIHLTTLRSLLPPNPNRSTTKTVKASILTDAVRRVKELKKRAADVALEHDGEKWWGCGAAALSGSFMFPSESDEATVIYCEGGEGKMVKATVCCEDRPGLNRDLTEAIRSVGARAVRAEMATVGGRTKAEVVVQWREGGREEDAIGSLRRALKVVVESGDSGCFSLGQIMAVNRYNGLGLDIPTNNRSRIYDSFNSNSSSSGEWEKLLAFF